MQHVDVWATALNLTFGAPLTDALLGDRAAGGNQNPNGQAIEI